MIATVRYDVHARTATEMLRVGRAVLSQFSDGVMNLDRWTIHVDVYEETVASDGTVLLWRGEVTAEHHDHDR